MSFKVGGVLTLLLVAASAACGPSTGPGGIGGSGGARPWDGGCGGGAGDPDAALPDATPPDPDAPIDRDAAAPDAMPPDVAPPDPGDCRVVVASQAIEGAQHMPLCAPLPYGTNPPSSGNHYAVWADYRTYDRPILRGFWVHSLEHGAMVITYNCAGGCADEVAAAEAFIDSLPADCGPNSRRLILAPDPELDVRFAASAWGFTLRANCFDRDAFSAFYTEHYDHAPESICGGGTDPTELCGGYPCP
jgi:hypothetical protein